jgi:hypothetical protein
MRNMSSLIGVIIFWLVFWVAASVPAYAVAKRRGVPAAGVAFVPIFGPWIVILQSTGRSGWMCLINLIPIAGLVFAIWAAFIVPSSHGRTRWWAAPFMIPGVNYIAFWIYAFTLETGGQAPAPVAYGEAR